MSTQKVHCVQYIKNVDVRHTECITHRAFAILDVPKCDALNIRVRFFAGRYFGERY